MFLYFVGGRWGAVGAYQMQNSTPAVPKHPHWVQISAPLLLVLLLNMLPQQRDDNVFFFHNEFVEFSITDFGCEQSRSDSPESIDYNDQNSSV